MTKGLVIACLLISFFSNAQVAQSALASGNWYKISVSQSGVYKIDYNFLKKTGMDVDKIDPRKLKIYGNGGGMLPQNNSTFRVDDLAENPIEIIGESDGKFNASDYLLFYAQGPNPWVTDAASNMFVHQKNLYSDQAYYFICYSETAGKRIETKLSPASNTNFQTSFDERLFIENDLYNVIHSGREWVGEDFSATNTRTYDFNITGYVSNTPIKLKAAAAVIYGLPESAAATINFQFKTNGFSFGTLPIASAPKCEDCIIGRTQSAVLTAIPNLSNTSALPITVSANSNADPNGKSYLNYLIVNFTKGLNIYNDQTLFRTLNPTPSINYQVKSASVTSKVWDVSTPYNPYLVANSSGSVIEFLSNADTILHEYVAFTPESVGLFPNYEGQISNQNIHGLPTPEMVIVTHSSLLAQANQLASYRESEGIKVAVVTTDQVYNEFSSGAQDITAIRDMCKMFYQRGGLKNLLLFGSCSYDYKNRVKNNSNLVPCYESRASFKTVGSYSSEDYYAFFGPNEGDWSEDGGDNYAMLIGVGRIQVKNTTEAQNAVNKLISYRQKVTLGKWRNKISFISDNGSNPNEGNTFVNDTEGILNFASGLNPNLNVNKIYLDAYKDKSTPSGVKTPGAAEAVRNSINQGALIMNYVGHGGPGALTQEGVITISLMEAWDNMKHLPFWITASCDFSTYDDPDKNSGGILMLNKADGGGIGIISATRAVYSNTNALLNNAFYSAVFTPMENGDMPTLGEVIKRTKNQSLAGVNNRSYTLIGDPSMTLNYPKYKAFVTKINNKSTDTVRALSEMKIEGIIASDNDSTLKSDFNGEIIFEIYDKPDTFNTLGQQYSIAAKFTQRSSVFYAGKAEVKNGRFTTNFIVPKDINYRFGLGKISMYAFDESQNTDAAGYMSSLVVGGGAVSAPIDTIPPVINLFMNDTTFKNGGLTSSSPFLLANLYDKSGINIARSSVGHEITVTIDEDSENPIVLNDFYESALNNYQNGKVNFEFSSLAEGNHSITFKAWDTYNNSATKKIDFVVSNTAQIKLQNLFNYPNPASEYTIFQFIHNYAGEDVALDIEIMDGTGRSVYKISDVISQSSATIDYRWDINATNNILAGIYVYRCKVRSLTNNSEALAVEKLVIIR